MQLSLQLSLAFELYSAAHCLDALLTTAAHLGGD